MPSAEVAIRYHEETKHHFGRYARSPGHLDWANQPDPFRRYEGAATVLLPLAEEDTSPPFADVYSVGAVPPRSVSLESIAQFLEHALGLSAWKEFQGARWALRCNPSSGNLHPTEGYVLCDALDGFHEAPAVYHYAPQAHALERRAAFDDSAWNSLTGGYPSGTFFVALSSIHWREAWKYGERAYRYCQHDVGHALAAQSYSAASLGWRVFVCRTPSDADIRRVLGIDRVADFAEAEREHADLIAAVVPQSAGQPTSRTCSSPAFAALNIGPWQGTANRLSRSRVTWGLIDAVTDACAKPVTPPVEWDQDEPAAQKRPSSTPSPMSAWTIIKRRRSAVAMDGRTVMPACTFYAMLARTMPWTGSVPWDALGRPDTVSLVIFVHRVEGLAPGLYCLVRAVGQLARLRGLMKPEFRWVSPPDCPEDLPLYVLAGGDYRRTAGAISCGQDIAADGAFSLSMIADFEEPLRTHGGWFYRRLFWEAGMIGQVLYLEAEAAGVRGTGIGCFFDDAMHDLVGLSGHAFQSLYHFTVGAAREDLRLRALPAYSAERRAAGGRVGKK